MAAKKMTMGVIVAFTPITWRKAAAKRSSVRFKGRVWMWLR
jgi:hypothetical protein